MLFGSRRSFLARTNRIVALDGTRAVALLAIFLHHAGIFSPGWFAVDYFFVLSGYLITSVLIEQRERDGSRADILRTFYVRRAKRILPPLAFAILLAWVLGDPTVAKYWPWYASFTANFGKAAGVIPDSGLGVLWSLAIEEHFYLIFPFLFLFLSRRALVWVLSLTLVIEPLLRLFFTLSVLRSHNYGWIYFATPFRLDAIALGCLFAILFHRNPYPSMQRGVALTLLIAGAILMVLCSRDPWFFRDANAPLFNSIGYSLVALLSGGALLWIVTEPDGFVSRVLKQPVLVWVGTVSYTAYLIHLVIMFAARHFLGESVMHQHQVRYRLFTFPATLLIAALSWYFIERPILSHGRIQATTLPTTERAEPA